MSDIKCRIMTSVSPTPPGHIQSLLEVNNGWVALTVMCTMITSLFYFYFCTVNLTKLVKAKQQIIHPLGILGPGLYPLTRPLSSGPGAASFLWPGLYPICPASLPGLYARPLCPTSMPGLYAGPIRIFCL